MPFGLSKGAAIPADDVRHWSCVQSSSAALQRVRCCGRRPRLHRYRDKSWSQRKAVREQARSSRTVWAERCHVEKARTRPCIPCVSTNIHAESLRARGGGASLPFLGCHKRHRCCDPPSLRHPPPETASWLIKQLLHPLLFPTGKGHRWRCQARRESSPKPSSGALLRCAVQDLLGNVSQGGEGGALGKLPDEVSAFLQALAKLGVQGNGA